MEGQEIRKANKKDLLELWGNIVVQNANKITKGPNFESLICRAFELEGATVDYGYTVKNFDTITEQIDGLISIDGLNCIIECKNQIESVDFEPIAKLRSRLQRRPSNTIGSIFTTSSFTKPAIILNQFLHPQTILMWEKEEIFHALEQDYLIDGLKIKYKNCIKFGLSNYNLLEKLIS